MARVIKKSDRLKMLYLLTVADSMATGPKAWNDWTSSLLRNLFFKVLNVLESGELATGRAVRTVEKKQQAVVDAMAGEMDPDQLDMLLKFMSPPLHALHAGCQHSQAPRTIRRPRRTAIRVAG